MRRRSMILALLATLLHLKESLSNIQVLVENPREQPLPSLLDYDEG